MIFSQWQPDGGFKYYESSVRHPIGDDLPDPRLVARSKFGVPAQDAGHPLPPDAVEVGFGPLPRGIMTPMSRDFGRGLGQAKTKLTTDETVVVLFLLGVLGVAAWSSRRR